LKAKLLILFVALILLVAATPVLQSFTPFANIRVKGESQLNTVNVSGAVDVNGSTTFDGPVDVNGAITLDGATTLGTVTAPVVGYASTGKRQFCATNTITDTATYTSLTTAVTGPLFAWCTLNAVTADANGCGATFGQTANVTITIKNSAITPAANAAGASVTWCVLGTP
jgi:hypothetical protein